MGFVWINKILYLKLKKKLFLKKRKIYLANIYFFYINNNESSQNNCMQEPQHNFLKEIERKRAVNLEVRND